MKNITNYETLGKDQFGKMVHMVSVGIDGAERTGTGYTKREAYNAAVKQVVR